MSVHARAQRFAAAAFAGLWAAAGLRGQADVVRSEAEAPVDRCRALVALQAEGRLDAALLGDALCSGRDALRDCAAALLRHQWEVWPPELLQRLERTPDALAAVLTELAIAPRPGLDTWVAHKAASAQDPVVRLLALAARARPMDRTEGVFAVRALAGEAGSAAAVAVAHLPAAVADDLVGVCHAQFAAGAPVERFGPWFDRLSLTGARQLLGIAAQLEGPVADRVAEQLALRDDPAFWDRVRAAADGEIALAPPWLPRVGRFLDTTARRERVLALLADGASPDASRIAAFDALLDAGVWDERLLAFVQAGGADRWWRLLERSPAGMPAEVTLMALDGSTPVRATALRQLVHRRLRRAEEQRLIALGDELTPFRAAAVDLLPLVVAALAASGGDDGTAAALRLARPDQELLLATYDALGARRDPIAAAALHAEFGALPRTDDAAIAGRRDRLELVLAEGGDRACTIDLLASVARRPTSQLRRCRGALRDLTPEQWRGLVAATATVADADARIELLLWLGGAEIAEARALLHHVLATAEVDEERETALAALCAGPERGALLARWREDRGALGLDPELVALTAIATLPEVLGEADVELLQFLLFTAPRTDPRERERAAADGGGRTGFPVVGALANRLRREPALAARLCAPAAALAAAGDTAGLVRQRFLYLWNALAAAPQVRADVAMHTAGLVLAIPDDAAAGAGIANHYRACDLAAQGQFAAAAAAARVAVGELLCLPDAVLDVRIHLGVRDDAAGSDPYAALAAASWIHTARAALARGDARAARTALATAAEFAGRDAATQTLIRATLEDCR